MASSSLSSRLIPSSSRSLSPPSLPSSSSSTICLQTIHPSQQCTNFTSSPAGLQRHRPPTHGPQSGRSCAQEPSSQCAGQAYGGLGIILHSCGPSGSSHSGMCMCRLTSSALTVLTTPCIDSSATLATQSV